MMARHTHIVSLGLFHKTFHSSLLQETFCFLMYDVLLSIYKINLIKKNKSCDICLVTFIFPSKDHPKNKTNIVVRLHFCSIIMNA